MGASPCGQSQRAEPTGNAEVAGGGSVTQPVVPGAVLEGTVAARILIKAAGGRNAFLQV